jgi:hypothetical protein
MTSATPTSRLFVEHLYNRYLVAGDQGAAEELRDRLERSIRADLPSALAATLDRILNPEDSSIWFVRRLVLDFPLNAEIDPGNAAHVWAAQIAGALSDAMRDRHGVDAIRFSDRTSYIAQFLLDLVAGSSWDKWYYENFAGLRALSVTAALRTAILDDPETGLDVLHILGNKALTIARALCGPDAARVLIGLSAGPSVGNEAECVSAVAGIAPGILHGAGGDEQRHALILFLTARQSHPGLDRKTLAKASRAIAWLCRWIAEGGLAPNQLRSGGRLLAIYRALEPEHAALLAPFLASGSTVLDTLLSSGPPAGVPPESRAYTHFGGMFLLLPLIDEMPITDGCSDWPNPDGGADVLTLARFLILIKCLGGRQAFGCSSDTVVRDSMHIPPDLAWQSIAAWSNRLRPEHLDQLLDSLFAWHLEIGAAIGPPFEFARARCRGVREIFEVDPARGIWIRRRALLHGAEVSQDATPDLDYVVIPRSLGIRRGVDIALSIAAQAVLRNFAWKLPGFSQSSLPYLAANFLNCTAAIEPQPGRTVVRIGRTPLNLILGITGLNSSSYSVSWKPLPYALFPEG